MTEYEAAKEVIRDMYERAYREYIDAVKEYRAEAPHVDEEERAFLRECRRIKAVRKNTLHTLMEQLDMRVEYKINGIDWASGAVIRND